jgi:elongator complex protein 3
MNNNISDVEHASVEPEVCEEILCRLKLITQPTRESVEKIKLEVCREKASPLPRNSEILRYLHEDEAPFLLTLLQNKPVRTISGVAVIAVMTAPSPCPKDKPCIYCPGGPKYGVPQSYTGFEPAAMRGQQNLYDPFMQVKSRLEQLKAIGHSVNKNELIIMGGTFPATSLTYQRSFVKACLDALNGSHSISLNEAKKKAESSGNRCVGITVETRPDYCVQKHIDILLNLGITRVELGVQTVYDNIYKIVNRGHSVQDVVEATRFVKDSGLKLCYHMMSGLPGSNLKMDYKAFQSIFNDNRFRPDMLKIYPCLVIEGTELFDLWKEGRYPPYSIEETIELLANIKKIVPKWIRVMRIQRDIPANLIMAGVRKSNLRQLVKKRMEERGEKCKCIRCREVGHGVLKRNLKVNLDKIQTKYVEYDASNGQELFISIEDIENELIIGYLRLRIPSEKTNRPEISSKSASIVREIKICGPVVPIGQHNKLSWQHKGYGRQLLSEAERISLDEFNRNKIVITSALGTKKYYGQLGYRYDGPYMSKIILR